MTLVQCQSAEQYIFWARNTLTKIPCLARWDYDKVPWLHHYYCRDWILFVDLFRVTFVMLLKSSSLLVPDSAVLLGCADYAKVKGDRKGIWWALDGMAKQRTETSLRLPCEVCVSFSVLGALPVIQSFGFWCFRCDRYRLLFSWACSCTRTSDVSVMALVV